MWDTLWVDANLATMAPGKPYGAIERGAVAAKDGRIAWVGYAADLPKPPDELAREVRRCNNAWITPGFVDCHTHLVFGGELASPQSNNHITPLSNDSTCPVTLRVRVGVPELVPRNVIFTAVILVTVANHQIPRSHFGIAQVFCE